MVAKTKTKISTKVNSMRTIDIDKVTVNVCVGNDKLGMVKAEKLLVKLTNKTPVKCSARKRLATWQIRPGLHIGLKVTLRGDDAIKFLKWALESKGNNIKESSLDTYGNFSVGFLEYLDLNGMKYDADIGIIGFEFMVTFARPGFRVKLRNLKTSKVPLRHKVTKNEVVNYLQDNLGVSVK